MWVVQMIFVAPNDLLLWMESTKVCRLFRGEGLGRIPEERRLKTLTYSDKTFSRNFYVEAVSPIIGTVDLHVAPMAPLGALTQ